MRWLALAVAMTLVSACHDTDGVGFDERKERRIEWANLGIADYRISFQHSGNFGGFGTTQLTVENGVITAAIDLADGTPVTDSLRLGELRTINGAFDEIDKALDDGVDKLDVYYDPIRNFPATIAVDPSTHYTDDEYGISLSDFAMP